MHAVALSPSHFPPLPDICELSSPSVLTSQPVAACARAHPAAQGLIRLEGTVVSVRGVSGQANLVKSVLTGAVNKYKSWAEKEKGAAFVKDVDVTFNAEDPIKNS